MTSPIGLDSRVRPTRDQVSTGVEEDVVILSLEDSVYYGLNEVGARIWSLMSEPRFVSEIVDTVLVEYEVDREDCEADVLAIIRDLLARGLVEVVH